jgi:hypothetical protein
MNALAARPSPCRRARVSAALALAPVPKGGSGQTADAAVLVACHRGREGESPAFSRLSQPSCTVTGSMTAVSGLSLGVARSVMPVMPLGGSHVRARVRATPSLHDSMTERNKRKGISGLGCHRGHDTGMTPHDACSGVAAGVARAWR